MLSHLLMDTWQIPGLTVCVGGGTDRLGGGGRRGGGGGGGGGGASWTVERELFDALTGTYDAGTRPVLSASTPVRVNFSISLHQIMDLVRNNYLHSSCGCQCDRTKTTSSSKYRHTKNVQPASDQF